MRQPGQYVTLESWAWQAVAQLVHQVTVNRTGDDLARLQALAARTLIPSAPTVKSGASDLGYFEWITYPARDSEVEIVLEKRAGGARRVLITATGLPTENGQPTQERFSLARRR